MKKLFLFCLPIITMFAVSCTTNKPIPPVNTEPVVIESSLSKDEVWSKLIDYLALNGTSIKIIDKESGLMTTEPYSFINSYTTTDKLGNPIDTNAYVVSNMKASSINGNWNIRVKPNNNGGSTININITNLSGYKDNKNLYGTVTSTTPLILKSTRVFENEIAEKIK